MAEQAESKSEKLGLNVTPTELRSLEFIRRIHPDRYEGTSSVLRDYSITDAVRAYELAQPVAA